MSVRDEYGLECPKCKSDEHLTIEMTVAAKLREDGPHRTGDSEWNDESWCQCDNCDHSGTVLTFRWRNPRIAVLDQKKWITDHGGDLDGYIARYGDPALERCYGNGGTAIFKADHDELQRLIEAAG